MLGAGLAALTGGTTILAGATPAQAAGAAWAYVENQTLYVQSALLATNTFYVSDSVEGFRVNDTTTGVQLDHHRTGGASSRRPT
jgi:hypothetical protein